MKHYSYSVGELKKLIRESSNEFEPKLGPNVKTDNKKNNEKSYKDSEKKAKDFDGGLKEPKKGKLQDKPDANRTTLDYNPVTEPDKDYKERIEAQAQGYTSKLEKNNKIEKSAEFDNDGKLMKYMKDKSNEINDEKKKLSHSGLQGSKLPETDKEKNTLYERKTKRLVFKYSKFLNESQVIARIPEEYKVDGQKIYMKDSDENEYLVECVKSEKSGNIETNIVSYSNKKQINEQVNRIQELMNFGTRTSYAAKTNQERINESKTFDGMMNLARMKNKES